MVAISAGVRGVERLGPHLLTPLFHQPPQCVDPFRHGVGEVVSFGKIISEIVELESIRFEEVYQFEIPFAYGA